MSARNWRLPRTCIDCGEELRNVDLDASGRAEWCSACKWQEHEPDDFRCNDCHDELGE